MSTRTQPEWPEAGQPDVKWDFGQQAATVYWHSSIAGGVSSIAGKLLHVTFGKNAQHPRSICIS